MKRLAPWVMLLIGSVGCGSSLGAAKAYENVGKHEIALLYYAENFNKDRNNQDAKQLLHDSFRRSIQTIDADYERAVDSKSYVAALKLANRRVALLAFASSVGLAEQAAEETSDLIPKMHAKAAKEVMKDADRVEKKGTPHERLRALQAALAFKPDSSELALAVDRARRRLLRRISPKILCRSSLVGLCSRFTDRVSDTLTEARRNLISLVEANSKKRDAQMTVTLQTTLSDTNWRRIESGQAFCKVPSQDDLRRVIPNQYFDAVAAYSVYTRTTEATVTADVRIKDLRPPYRTLLSFKSSESGSSAKQYFSFKGDERAFNPITFVFEEQTQRWLPVPNETAGVVKYGTDRSPPTPVEDLQRDAWQALADQVASQILAELENR